MSGGKPRRLIRTAPHPSTKAMVSQVSVESRAYNIIVIVHVDMVASTLQTLEQLQHRAVGHTDVRLEGVILSYMGTYLKRVGDTEWHVLGFMCLHLP